LSLIGENLPAIIRGEKNIIELLMQDNILGSFYAKTLGIDFYLDEIARMSRQISHRYPHLNVLEIGEFRQIPTTFWCANVLQALVLELPPREFCLHWARRSRPTHTQIFWTANLTNSVKGSRSINQEWRSRF
jgi:hypothetical protein